MLKPESSLRPNEEEVASKVMDGEAILINLSNGIYYSMDKVGGVDLGDDRGQAQFRENRGGCPFTLRRVS